MQREPDKVRRFGQLHIEANAPFKPGYFINHHQNAQPTPMTAPSQETLRFYDAHASQFWEGTRDHDVKQNIDALLRHIQAASPLRILDLGCGPGRDLLAFKQLGHQAIGVDGSREFVQMARAYSGCTVWEQNFLELDLPPAHFDGIFANASLFHVPSASLPDVLTRLHRALNSNGVLFTSNPRGNNEEGWQAGRYGVYHDLEQWRGFLVASGFVELEHYYRPQGLPREQQNWLASVWRKVAD